MATREYRFITGPETSTLPTIGTPSEGSDLISLDYANQHYGKYSIAFLIADWTGPAGGYYTKTILQATHLKDSPVAVEVQKKDGTNYLGTICDYTINASGDVILRVVDTPDCRFDGKVIIK